MTGSSPYEVRIRRCGSLDAAWSSRLPGLAVRTDIDDTTVLRGSVVDQAALHGVLDAIRDLGLALISVDAGAVSAVAITSGGR